MQFDINRYVENKETKKSNSTKKKNIFRVLRYKWLKYKRKHNKRMQNKQIKKEMPSTNFTLSNNLTFILIALIFAGAYMFNEHQKIAYKEQLRQEEKQEALTQKKAYDICMADAYANYISNWNDMCKALGKKKDCLLPRYNANTQEERYNEAKKRCMEQYKNKMFD